MARKHKPRSTNKFLCTHNTQSLLICPQGLVEFLFFRILMVTFELVSTACNALTQTFSMSKHVKICLLFHLLLLSLLPCSFLRCTPFRSGRLWCRVWFERGRFSVFFFFRFLFLFLSLCLLCLSTRRLAFHRLPPRSSRSFVRVLHRVRSFELTFERRLHTHSTQTLHCTRQTTTLVALRLHRPASPAQPSRWPIRPCRSHGLRCRRIRLSTTQQRKISRRVIRVRRQQQGTNEAADLARIGPARCIRITPLACRAALSALSLRVPAVSSSASVQSSSTRASCRR